MIGHLAALADVAGDSAQSLEMLARQVRAATAEALPAMLQETSRELVRWADEMEVLDQQFRGPMGGY